jgi:uncharacterized protein YndB with AHSA1/START domain
MAQRQVSVTRTIAAPPEAIFALLVDPRKHVELDGSGTVRASRSVGPRRLELNSRFGMDMKLLGVPYRIRNQVVEYEENRLITWRHFYGHRWRWQLRDLGDGRTEVTETFDWAPSWMPLILELVRFPAKNKKAIRATLAHLDQLFPSPA